VGNVDDEPGANKKGHFPAQEVPFLGWILFVRRDIAPQPVMSIFTLNARTRAWAHFLACMWLAHNLLCRLLTYAQVGLASLWQSQAIRGSEVRGGHLQASLPFSLLSARAHLDGRAPRPGRFRDHDPSITYLHDFKERRSPLVPSLAYSLTRALLILEGYIEWTPSVGTSGHLRR
jgi:hypothetical protein